MSQRIKVALIEDHPHYRQVVQRALQLAEGIELVGMFGAAEIALRRFESAAGDGVPDVILLDLNLPGVQGVAAIDDLFQAVPSAKIIVLTQSNSKSDIEAAICSGAQGYLLKSSTLSEIIDSIQMVFQGGVSIDKEVAGHLLQLVQAKLKPVEPGVDLSPREHEILVLLSRGLVKKEIAEKLNLSYGSVATYVRRIYDKFDVQNAAAAVDQAYRSGVLRQTKRSND